MLRSRLVLGLSAPAAILTLLVHPMVQATADQLPVARPAIEAAANATMLPLPGMRPVSLAITPTRTRTASVQADTARAAPHRSDTAQEMELKTPMKPRRMMREGCEAALSSLVGPEARRMSPGRCIS